MRMTSAPSCASVMPPSGAATKADASTMRRPARMPSFDMVVSTLVTLRPAERSFQQAARDHLQRERFLRAFEDRQHARIDEVAADRRLFGVAHAAVDLQRLARDPLGRAAREQLHQARLHATATAVEQPADGIGELAARGEARRHLARAWPASADSRSAAHRTPCGRSRTGSRHAAPRASRPRRAPPSACGRRSCRPS